VEHPHSQARAMLLPPTVLFRMVAFMTLEMHQVPYPSFENMHITFYEETTLTPIRTSSIRCVITCLEAPLNGALAQLNRNHDTPGCNQLNAFLNQVNAKQTNGQLTPQQATDITQQANAIQQAIGCSNISGMLRQTSPSLLPLPMP
jgi:hypothetical protein